MLQVQIGSSGHPCDVQRSVASIESGVGRCLVIPTPQATVLIHSAAVNKFSIAHHTKRTQLV